MKEHRRVCANIDLSAIRANFLSMASNLKENTKMFAVVKSDGYGHGAVEAAQVLEDLPMLHGYCVATVE